jgi:hypothetical protein
MRATVSAVTAAGLLAALVIPGTAASAATSARHCANRTDYRRVHKGQTVSTVNRLLHAHGHILAHASGGGYRTEIKSYPTCSQFSAISISFSANPHRALHLDGKSAVWVS